MRLAILADIHGSATSLRAVLDELDRNPVEGILVAGDLISGGPQPMETLDLLRARGGILIRGNGEDYFSNWVNLPPDHPWFTSRQWSCVHFACQRLSRRDLDYLTSLPAERTVEFPSLPPIRLLHGSPGNPSRGLAPDADLETIAKFIRSGLIAPDGPPRPLAQALASVHESVVICAHTHIPWMQRWDGRLAINPGSVSCPIDGRPGAQYAILEWVDSAWQVEFHSIAHDLDRIHQDYVDTGFLAAGGGMARAVLADIAISRNTPWFLVKYAYRLAESQGIQTDDFLPNEIWDQAVESFDWQNWEPR